MGEGNGLTLTMTLFEFEQPVPVTFSVRTYTVVTNGVTTGFDKVDVNPVGIDVQLYEFPGTGGAPICVLAFWQMSRFGPVTAAGNGLTVTVTLWLLVQPVAVMVSERKYVVVTSGETTGLAVTEVNPGGTEVHE